MLNIGGIYTTEKTIIIVVEPFNYYEFPKEKLNDYSLVPITNKMINAYIENYYNDITLFDFSMYVHETDYEKFKYGYLGKLTDENLKKLLTNANNV